MTTSTDTKRPTIPVYKVPERDAGGDGQRCWDFHCALDALVALTNCPKTIRHCGSFWEISKVLGHWPENHPIG